MEIFNYPKYRHGIFTILAIFSMLCGCKKSVNETAGSRLAEQAKQQMMIEITNEMVGLNRVLDAYVDDLTTNNIVDEMKHPDLANWVGSAKVEYVNHLGGIDRTNLYFRFEYVPIGVSTNCFLACLPDYKKYMAISE